MDPSANEHLNQGSTESGALSYRSVKNLGGIFVRYGKILICEIAFDLTSYLSFFL
jgi:hypothetical protein